MTFILDIVLAEQTKEKKTNKKDNRQSQPTQRLSFY
jgi:hypothetical protein